VHLIRFERERRREERVPGLVRRQVGVGGAFAPYRAGVLRTGPVDETRLADPARVELLKVGQRPVHRVQRRPATADTPVPVTGFGVELAELGTVRGQQDDGTGAREVGVEHLRLLGGVVRQRVALAGQCAGVPTEPGGHTDDQQCQCTRQYQ